MLHICFFDGYRSGVLASKANFLRSYIKSLRTKKRTLLNLRINQNLGNDDTLENRWERSQEYISHCLELNWSVSIIGYSMGCHLAVKFALELAERRSSLINDIYLIAPDPKFRKCRLDSMVKSFKEAPASKEPHSAYDEAKELWQAQDAAGEVFLSTLQRLTVMSEGRIPITIAYSKQDEVAEWSRNVETLIDLIKSNSGVTTIEVDAHEKRHVAVANILIAIDPRKATKEHWVHQQLFERTRCRK